MLSSTSVVDIARLASSTPMGAHHRHHLQTRWWTLLDSPAMPPRGPTIDVISDLVVDAVGPTGSATQGPTIDVIFKPRWWTLPDPLTALPRGPPSTSFLKLGGGCYRTRRQHLPGGQPSMSS
jgi:hypothetical protein